MQKTCWLHIGQGSATEASNNPIPSVVKGHEKLKLLQLQNSLKKLWAEGGQHFQSWQSLKLGSPFLTRIPTHTAKATRSSACGPWEAVNFSIETKNPRQNWMFACLPCGPGAKWKPHSNQNKLIAIAEGETWQRHAKRNSRNTRKYRYIIILYLHENEL